MEKEIYSSLFCIHAPTAWTRIPVGAVFTASPPGALMKSHPSFIKIRGRDLVIKEKKKKRGENKPSLTRSHLRSTRRSKAQGRWGVNGAWDEAVTAANGFRLSHKLF